MHLSCSLWDLVPWAGMDPKLPALGARSLSHWTTREVPPSTSLSAGPPVVLVWTNPRSGIPSYSSLACQQPSAQLSWSRVTTPKNRHNPSRWRTSCWLLSSSLTIHTMWQITRNANSWPIPNCLASLPAWVLGNLCATVQRRAVDLKQTAWYFSSKHRLIWDQLRIAIQGLQLTSLFFWWKSTVPAQC